MTDGFDTTFLSCDNACACDTYVLCKKFDLCYVEPPGGAVIRRILHPMLEDPL